MPEIKVVPSKGSVYAILTSVLILITSTGVFFDGIGLSADRQTIIVIVEIMMFMMITRIFWNTWNYSNESLRNAIKNYELVGEWRLMLEGLEENHTSLIIISLQICL